MKKLFLMVAMAALLAGTSGCESCRSFFRGSLFEDPCAPVCCDPCAPAVSTCDPCSGASVQPSLPAPGTYQYGQ